MKGLVYAVDLTGFTSYLSGADDAKYAVVGGALLETLFNPVAQTTTAICNGLPLEHRLVNIPGDACIVAFTSKDAFTPDCLTSLVNELITMTKELKVLIPIEGQETEEEKRNRRAKVEFRKKPPVVRPGEETGECFQLKYGMDFGLFCECNDPSLKGGGQRTDFTPSVIIGDAINRLSRILSSPVDGARPEAARISAELWQMMSDTFRNRPNKPCKIKDYPQKGSENGPNARTFYVLL